MFFKGNLSRQLLTFFCIFFFGSALSQEKYDPLLLIPYKKGQLWGWADTLGNIHIKPKYSFQTSFFEIGGGGRYIGKIHVDTLRCHYVRFDGSMVLKEKEFAFISNQNLEMPSWVVISDNGKRGVYNPYSDSIVVPVEQDTVLHYFTDGYSSVIFYKKKTDKFYKKYKAFEQLDNTEYKYIKIHEISRREKFVEFIDSANNAGIIIDARLIYLEKEELVKLIENPSSLFKSSDSGFSLLPPPMTVDETFEEMDGKLEVGAKVVQRAIINFRAKLKLYVISKNEKLGVVTQDYKTILPTIYDNIMLTPKNIFVGRANKKGFYLILEKPVGEIELKGFDAIYDEIEGFEKRVKKERTYSENEQYFIVAKVIHNGETFYVGENGVKYFSKD